MAAPRRSAKASADTSHEEAEPLDEAAEGPESAAEPKNEDSGPTAMERAYMDALKRERAGYELRGMKDRMAQVDAELKRMSR